VQGRAQYSSLNQAIDELNSALEEKYTFIAKPFASYTGRNSLKLGVITFFTFVSPFKSKATIVCFKLY
jgi:hypothetical protein